jgi:c-di-GMP-binding flagellar brake protein YcgR
VKKPEESNLDHILKVNQRLEIMLTSAPGEKFTSRIEEINPDNLIIAMPMAKGHPILLHNGSEFFVRLVVHSAAYQFSCIFLDKRIQPIPVWIASLPRNIKRIQQRAFVRIDTALPVHWQSLSSEEAPIIRSITKDISGGGVRLVSKKPIPLGEKLNISIQLADIGPLELICEVVRVEQPKSDVPIFWIGTKFLDLAENTRNKIIKFIFRKQLEERQKGL